MGDYFSNFSFESYQEIFQWDVYSRLTGLLQRLASRVEEGGELESQVAAEIHRDVVMHSFYQHSSQGRSDAFISHSTCFACLFEPPEHPLPCGHILCTSCLRAYGHARGRTVVEIDGCPLEASNKGFWRVFLKPSAAGVRILTLDGYVKAQTIYFREGPNSVLRGGIRGIVELEILRQLECALGGSLPEQCFFDLIIGTRSDYLVFVLRGSFWMLTGNHSSTGGLIALGLVAKNWSVEECTRYFEDLCKKAFTRRTGSSIPGIGWFIENYNHSKYETRPLEDALIGAYSEKEYLFGGARPYASYGAEVKVAVTATSAAGSAVIFANYNRLCAEKR